MTSVSTNLSIRPPPNYIYIFTPMWDDDESLPPQPPFDKARDVAPPSGGNTDMLAPSVLSMTFPFLNLANAAFHCLLFFFLRGRGKDEEGWG